MEIFNNYPTKYSLQIILQYAINSLNQKKRYVRKSILWVLLKSNQTQFCCRNNRDDEEKQYKEKINSRDF